MPPGRHVGVASLLQVLLHANWVDIKNRRWQTMQQDTLKRLAFPAVFIHQQTP